MTGRAGPRQIIHWHAPVQPDPALSGLEQMRGAIQGGWPPPPISALIGQRVVAAEPGCMTLAIDPAEQHDGILGSMHGGVVATLLDSAMTCAAMTGMPPGRFCTTLDFRVAFHRGATVAGGALTARGTVVHGGRQVIAAEGLVTDAQGRLVATGSTNCFAFELPASPQTPGPSLLRQREVDIPDPATLASGLGTMTGLGRIQAMLSGGAPLPPAAILYGATLDALTGGAVRASMPAGEWLLNPGGTVHGGAIGLLALFAMECAVQANLPRGGTFQPLELTVRFHRAVTVASDRLMAVGTVLDRGPNTASATARLTDAAGRLCASASCTGWESAA